MNTTTDELSIRESLEDAFKSEDNATVGAPDAPVDAAPESPAPESPAPVDAPADEPLARTDGRDESGKFAAKAPSAPEGVQAAEKVGQPPAPKSATDKAPHSWSPSEREAYKDMSPVARQAAHRMEQVTQQTLRESAEDRKFSTAMKGAIAPFEHFIRAEGSDHIRATENLFATAARLRTGTAPELAQLVSGLIQQFGVGRFGQGFIGQLDEALSGQAPREEHPDMAAMRNQFNNELAPLRQMQQQMQQNEQAQRQNDSQAAERYLSEFSATAEFLGDVRQEMADIIDSSARRGQTVSIQQAYDAACRLHPEISQVLQNREQGRIAQGMNQTARRARNAGVSVGGSPALGSSGVAPESLREALMLAVNSNTR